MKPTAMQIEGRAKLYVIHRPPHSAGEVNGRGPVVDRNRILTEVCPIRLDSPQNPPTDPSLQMRERDRNLVDKCLRGDESAWETIIRLYGKRILNLCFRFTRRRDEAEDLVQDIFIRAYRTLRTFRSETGTFHHWLFRLGRNLIIDHYRREKRLAGYMGSETVESLALEDVRTPSPLRIAEQAETAQFVMDGLKRLSTELREAVLLRDIEGLTYQEIARMAGISEGTIKSRVSRGRLQLARALVRRREHLTLAFCTAN